MREKVPGEGDWDLKHLKKDQNEDRENDGYYEEFKRSISPNLFPVLCTVSHAALSPCRSSDSYRVTRSPASQRRSVTPALWPGSGVGYHTQKVHSNPPSSMVTPDGRTSRRTTFETDLPGQSDSFHSHALPTFSVTAPIANRARRNVGSVMPRFCASASRPAAPWALPSLNCSDRN